MNETKTLEITVEELDIAIGVFEKLATNNESLWFISESAHQALYQDNIQGLRNYIRRIERQKLRLEQRNAERSRYF